MTYAVGSVNSASLPSHELRTRIETELTAHASWGYVKEVIPSTQPSVTYRVWKNAAAGNIAGKDFYFQMRCDSNNFDTLWVSAFEQFDATTDEVFHEVIGTTNTQAFNTPDGCYHHIWRPIHAGPWETVNVNTISFDYHIFVARDWVNFQTSVNQFSYRPHIGVFETLVGQHKDDFPFAMLNSYSTQWSGIRFSRHVGWPNNSTKSTSYFNYGHQGSLSAYYWTPVDGTIPTSVRSLYSADSTDANMKVLGARPYARQRNLAIDTATTPTRYTGEFRGIWRDIMIFSTDGNVQVGDTVTVDGVGYTYMGASAWCPTAA